MHIITTFSFLVYKIHNAMKFLAITDLHYSLRDVEGAERRNILSAGKLRRVIGKYAPGCDFIVNLGDTADAGFGDQRALITEISDILFSAGLPVYSLIGNHDTSLPKDGICRILKMPGRYYSVDTAEYTMLFLDANMNDPNAPLPEDEIDWSETYLDPVQLDFVRDALGKSDKPAFVFCHELFTLQDPDPHQQQHVIRNAADAIRIFEESGKVRAVFCGHYHPGCRSDMNGIEYVTFRSLCLGEEENCAVVNYNEKGLSINTYGL